MGGLALTPLRSTYLAAVPADARGNAMSVMNTVIYLLTTAVAVLMFGLVGAGVLPPRGAGAAGRRRGAAPGRLRADLPRGDPPPQGGGAVEAVRPGGLAHPEGGAADAGGGVLDRGRLGQLCLVQGRPADEEQAPG